MTAFLRTPLHLAAVTVAAFTLTACGEDVVEAPRTISTSGQGVVVAAPDVAHITIAVENGAVSAADALSANAETMTKVFEVVDEIGVSEADRSTRAVSLQPVYDTGKDADGRRVRQLIGYQALNALRVTIRDIDALGDALDKLTSAGSTTISGLSFEISDPGPLQDQARKLAVVDARRKAELLADEAGVDVDDVISISETDAGGFRPLPEQGAARAMQATTPVAAGSHEISASVTVVWSLD